MTPREKLAQQVHQEVNAQFPYASDQATWNQPEYWERISTAGRGDCEDYVLEKRARLLAAGVPASDLRIATVNVPGNTATGNEGGGHAVLVIRDGDRDLVADQTQPTLIDADTMKGLGYTADKIQVPGQFMWEKWEL